MQKRLTLLLTFIILCGVIITPLAAYAQEEGTTAETPAAEQAASGLPVLVLLLGVGAVVVVGGYMVLQTRAKEASDSK
jgi:hypothetical protein